MTELERLLIEQLSKLSEAHELQVKQLSEQLIVLSEQQNRQSQALETLSERVAILTQLLDD